MAGVWGKGARESKGLLSSQAHKNCGTMSEIEAKVRYVKLARSLKTYGVSFFLVKVRRLQPLLLPSSRWCSWVTPQPCPLWVKGLQGTTGGGGLGGLDGFPARLTPVSVTPSPPRRR